MTDLDKIDLLVTVELLRAGLLPACPAYGEVAWMAAIHRVGRRLAATTFQRPVPGLAPHRLPNGA